MSSPVPPELAAKIASWRLRAATNELSLEEMKEAIRHLRSGRVAAAASSATVKRKAAIAVIPHADDMLDELGSL